MTQTVLFILSMKNKICVLLPVTDRQKLLKEIAKRGAVFVRHGANHLSSSTRMLRRWSGGKNHPYHHDEQAQAQKRQPEDKGILPGKNF
jgi:hypothetical protein